MDNSIKIVTSRHENFAVGGASGRFFGKTLDAAWTPREKWLTINDFLAIAAQGYDQIRLPVDKKVLWRQDGSRDEEAFATIGSIASHARTAGLDVRVEVCGENGGGDEVWKTKTLLKSVVDEGNSGDAPQKTDDDFFGLRGFFRHAFA
jgi:hypothetical protein